MPIRVKCEECQKTLSVKDHLAGKKIKCPGCQKPITVGTNGVAPAGEAGSSTAAPAAPPKPANPAATKKPPTMGKPVAVLKSTVDRVKPNGGADPSKNGTAPPPPELPPENVEAEALAALADEPKPPEEEEPPQMIDFTCEHCDHELHLPLSEGGKRMQCPNPECRQLIKVPMPKIEAKKDWRKMDRKGPAAALINQPEQLEDAWGSQNATRARQDSLAQAGAIVAPPKPPRDATGWILLTFKIVLGGALAVSVVALGYRWVTRQKQHNAIAELDGLMKGLQNPNPIFRAEMNRALILLYLQEIKGADKSQKYVSGATVKIDQDAPGVNEQLFYLSKALAILEQGGGGEAVEFEHARRSWDKVVGDMSNAMEQFRDPTLLNMATREIADRLIAVGRKDNALQFAGDVAKDNDAPVKAQAVAVAYFLDEKQAIADFANEEPPLQKAAELSPAVRAGFAEGFARKGDFDSAMKMVETQTGAKDKLETLLGIAAVAWAAGNKEKAAEFVKEGANFVAQPQAGLTDANRLEFVRLAARTGDLDFAKQLKFDDPAFEARSLLEIFLATLEKSTTRIDEKNLADLGDLERVTKANDFVPLGLAWEALARQNAKLGASRGDNRQLFDRHGPGSNVPPEALEAIRPMVDVGTYLGSMAAAQEHRAQEPPTK